MAVKETLTIVAEAQVQYAQSQITALEKKIDSLTRTGSKVSSMKGGFDGLTKSIVKAGIVLASLRTVMYAITGITNRISTGFRDATKASDDFQGAILGLQSVVGKKLGEEAIPKAITEVERWQKTGLFTTGGVSTALKNFIAMGYSIEQAGNLVGVFADSAAFGRQRSLEFEEAVVSASEGVKNGNSILSDNAGITKNLSVILKEAGYSASDLSLATSDVNVRMALYNGLMKEGSLFTGDFIRLQQTQAGLSQRVGAMTELAMSKIGKSFDIIRHALSQGTLEFLGAITDIFTKEESLIRNATVKVASYVVVIIRLMGSLLSLLPVVGKYFEGMRTFSLKPLSKSLDEAQKKSSGVAGAIDGIGSSAKKAKKELLGLASFDVINVLSQASDNAGGGTGGGISLPSFEDSGFAKSLDGFNSIVEEANKRANKITEKLKGIWKSIEPFVMPIMEFFTKLFEETFGDPRLKGLWTFIAILGSIGIGILLLVNPVGQVILIITALLLLIAIWKESFFQAIEGVKKWWGELPKKFEENNKQFKALMDTWKNDIKSAIEQVKGFFPSLWEKVKEYWGKIGEYIGSVWDGVKKKFDSFSSGIQSGFKSTINGLIDKINSFTRGIGGIRIPDWVPQYGGRSFSIPQIPRLAQGGIVSSPTYAMIGESGAEAVMPLENNTGWIDQLASKINDKGGGTQQIRIDIDGRKVYEGFIDYYNDQSRLNNNKLIDF